MSCEALEKLKEARTRFSQKDIAERLDVNPKTVGRWERGSVPCPTVILPALKEILKNNQQVPDNADRFTFIDLFAGIGGIRAGFQSTGGKCIFTSEWNSYLSLSNSFITLIPDTEGHRRISVHSQVV